MGQKRNGVEENININQECNSKSFKVITLTKHAEESYGFSIIFNENLSQYIVKCVREGSIGQKCGIKTGDVICEINDNLIENLNLQDILLILKNSKTFLTLAVFDPSFQGDIRSTNKCNTQSPRIKNSSLDKSKMKREKSNRDSKKFCLLRRLSINSNKREKLKKRNSSGNSTELSDYNFCARKYLMDDSNTSSDKNSRHSSIIFKKTPNESNQDSTPSNNPVTDQSELIPDPCCHACKHQCGREVKNSSPDSPNNSKNKYLIYGHKMKNYPLQDISYNSFREVFNSFQIIWDFDFLSYLYASKA
ncbi:hypothetical protein HZS_6779 [Henneguya salminicola]|nr:hypothetical protein HZS_6779 [Henneguya salminicola]